MSMFKRSHFGGGLFAYEATLSNGNVAVWYPDGAFEDGDGVTAELLTFAKEDATYEHPLTRRHCRSLEDAHLLINPPKFRIAPADDPSETCDTCGDWIEIHAGLPVCKSGCAQGSNQ